jgi:hypothetical protein
MRWSYEATGGREGHELGFKAISYAGMVWRFADPLYLALYVVGILAASFHLGNGLFNFGIRWGITVGATAQKVSAVLWAGLGALLAVIGLWTAVNYHMVGKNFDGRGSIRDQYKTLDELVRADRKTPVSATAPGSTPTGASAGPNGTLNAVPGNGESVPPPAQ